MITNFPASDTGSRRRSRNAYACADGLTVACRYDVVRTGEEGELRVPRNGILLEPGEPPITVIAGARVSRDMAKIICSRETKTCTFPSTIVAVGENAFYGIRISSVRLNEGLKTLEGNCFYRAGIRSLVLPSSVESIG